MKTTVRMGQTRRVVITPGCGAALVRIENKRGELWELACLLDLTPDEAGAMMFGIEQALEVGEVKAQGAAA